MTSGCDAESIPPSGQLVHSSGECVGKRLLAGVVLYLLTCGRCWAPFAICASCYRGHRYCGPRCRRGARIESRRASNRRHQQSELGRQDHADLQREYRQRLAARFVGVTDQSSQGWIAFLTLAEPRSPEVASAALVVGGVVVCMVCGRSGPFIDFPRGGKRDRSRDRSADPASAPRGATGRQARSRRSWDCTTRRWSER